MKLITHIKDRLSGKVPKGFKRSGQWPAFRSNYLRNCPKCVVCGSETSLEVHHVLPFHLFPKLELDWGNLITLCESEKNGVNCHLWFGHLGNFKSYNRDAQTEARQWGRKFRERP